MLAADGGAVAVATRPASRRAGGRVDLRATDAASAQRANATSAVAMFAAAVGLGLLISSLDRGARRA
jgi:hypothetical protein